LLEQLADLLRLPVRARDRDLVAADEDLGIKRGLHELEELVALAEEGDHGLAARNDDLDLRRGFRQVVSCPGSVPASPSKKGSHSGDPRVHPGIIASRNGRTPPN